MSPRVRLPGFRYNARTRTARVSIVVPGTGSRIRRRTSFYDVTREQAIDRYRAFKAKVLALGGERPAGGLTLRGYVERFWEVMTLRVASSTKRGYESHLRNVILPELGDLPLPKINAATMRDLHGRMKLGRTRRPDGTIHEGPFAPDTINHVMALTRRILKDAEDREELSTFPIRGKLPREVTEPLKGELSDQELAAFLATFDDEQAFRRHKEKTRRLGPVRLVKPYAEPRRFGGGRLPDGEDVSAQFWRFRQARPFFVVAVETGLRLGDLLALRWAAIDLERGLMNVRMGKTKHVARPPITRACRAALEELRRRPIVGERVFLNEVGRRASWTTFRRHFALAKLLAGITRRVRFHDLRHTFGSRWVSKGMPLQDVSVALGHTTLRMTQRYSRVSDDAMVAAGKRFSEAVESERFHELRGPEARADENTNDVNDSRRKT